MPPSRFAATLLVPLPLMGARENTQKEMAELDINSRLTQIAP